MSGSALVQAISNRVNQAILGVLSVEASYPRRIGTLLSLPETEVARRLRSLEGLGLVSSEWAHIGRNVKLYRLEVQEIALRFSAAGIDMRFVRAADPGETTARIDAVAAAPPAATGFVGREAELAALAGPQPVVVVVGIPGIGKTSLLAQYVALQADRDRLLWQEFRGVESVNWLANRLALFFAQHGDRRLLEALEHGAESADRLALMAAGLREQGGLFIFDDVHLLTDDALTGFLANVVAQPGKARVVLAGREPPRYQPAAHVATLSLSGLDDEGVRRLLAQSDLAADDDVLAAVRAATGGHPLALNLLVEAARKKGRPLAEILQAAPGTGLEEYLLNEVDAGLSEAERRVLTLASVFRTTFTAEDLAALARRDEHATLRRLRQRHLVDAIDDDHRLHELLGGFFYHQAADKPALHARAAGRYLEQGTIEGRLEAMHHLLLAGRPDRVLDLLEEDLDVDDFDLIDTGYHNLYSTVLAHFSREDVLLPRRWGLIEDERGDIAFARGDDETAMRHYQEALAVFTREDDRNRVADLHWKRARALERLGRGEEARRAVEAGLEAGATDQLARDRLEALATRFAP